MRTIKWHMSIGFPSADRSGEFEVEDSATDTEIEEAARDAAFNFLDWGFEEITDRELYTLLPRHFRLDLPGNPREKP
jgi:hypothetical protein